MLIIKQFPAFYVSLLLLIRNINSLFYDDLAENTLIFIRPLIVNLSSAYSGTKSSL